MDIGKPQRVIRVEPLKIPPIREQPQPVPAAPPAEPRPAAAG